MTAPPHLDLVVCEPLRLFLAPRNRGGRVHVPLDPASTLGHVVQSLGIPLTEVGTLTRDGVPVAPSARADRAARVVIGPATRPQPWPTAPPAFVLDVHLGSLARRLWLLGLDAAYQTQADDDDLARQAVREQRILLTQDRGLLRRRALRAAAYVRGTTLDEQTEDVLDRFAPPLDPWTRCGACGGLLEPVDAEAVWHLLEPGTRRTYSEFSRCVRCGRPFWHGAHSRRLDAAVERAERVVAGRRRPSGGVPGLE